MWERAYHDNYQRGSNVVYQKGYHTDYQRGNNVSWQKGYHVDYQRGNNVSWQLATSGVVYEQFKNGSWQSESQSNFLKFNSTPDSTDNHRIRFTGTPSGWTSITLAQYNAANAAVGEADAVRTALSGPLTGWNSITAAEYNLSNTTPSDALDGFQTVNLFTSPFNLWVTATQTEYNAGNSTSASTDGFQTLVTGSATSWTSITSADYNINNTTADATDGFQTAKMYTSPFSLWENTTQAFYDPANSTTDGTDGWKTITSGSATSWTDVTQAQYMASNTTTDSTDGWQIVKAYGSPLNTWEATTQSIYNTNNTTLDSTDGYRTYRSYTSPFNAWESTDEATYVANKTAGVDPSVTTDGWTATKVYVPPYTGYDATHTYSRTNYDILGQLIDPAGLVTPITDVNGTVTNSEVANMYSTADWSKLQGALKAIALGQCGGTLTLQTRVGGTTPANDTFTYSNTTDNTKVETSGSKRSGTFDFAIPSGGSVTAVIQQQNVSALKHYTPAGWVCKAGGVPVIPSIIDVPGTPWDSIQVVIAANEALSCIQNVTWVP